MRFLRYTLYTIFFDIQHVCACVLLYMFNKYMYILFLFLYICEHIDINSISKFMSVFSYFLHLSLLKSGQKWNFMTDNILWYSFQWGVNSHE